MLIGYSYSSEIPGYKKSALAKSETNDCVVKSIASVYQISYEEAHKIAKEQFNRNDRQGTFYVLGTLNTLEKKNWIYNNKQIEVIKGTEISYLGSPRYQKRFIDNGYEIAPQKMTVGMITEKFNEGRYIILINGHAFTLIDGIIYGNNEDKKRKRAKVRGLIRIKDVVA